MLGALWLAAGCVINASAAPYRTAYISELLVRNERGLKDDENKTSPWIELHNGSDSVINLRGWSFTDDTNNLTKWTFPNVSLLPDKYLVVFASGKNRTNNLAPLHTSFRISDATRWIGLVDRATNLVSEITVAKSQADISLGRLRSEADIEAAFQRPTPGKANAVKGPGFAPEVSFSTSSGSFVDVLKVTLSCPTKGVVIRYTLDGSLPSIKSPEYREALTITNSVQVRARAFQQGLLSGPPHSEHYLRLHNTAREFTSKLPILVMDTMGHSSQTRHGSTVSLMFFEPSNGKTSLTNRPALATRGSFHMRGSTSSRMPQPGFAMHFVDEYNDDDGRAVLGLPSDADWVLYAPTEYDPVLIHNAFVHQLSRDMGRYSPRTRFLEAFIATGSGPLRDIHYAGLYLLEEKIKISKSRVNIDRLRGEDITAPDVTGGYVLKFDRLGPGEGGLWLGNAMVAYVDPREDVITQPQWAPQKEYLESYLLKFERSLYGASWLDPQRGYRSFLDVDAMIDYHVLEVLSGNVDSGIYSTFFYKPRDGRIVFGPHWDFDRALGSIDHRDEFPRQWNTGRFFRAPWWRRFCSDPDFWQQWVDRWQELRQTHFSVTNLHALANRLAAEISEAQPRQYRRWDFQPRGGSYSSELSWMKEWLSERVQFIDEQLPQPPAAQLKTAGKEQLLTLATEANATVYYTLDGTDPRLSRGALSTSAAAYKKPISVKPGTRLVARTYNTERQQLGGPPVSTPWSRPVRLEIRAN